MNQINTASTSRLLMPYGFDECASAVLERAYRGRRTIARRQRCDGSVGQTSLILIVSGWACRLDHCAGERRITDFATVRDLCGVERLFGGADLPSERPIEALSQLEFDIFDLSQVRRMAASEPALAAALLGNLSRQAGILRDTIARMAIRNSDERLLALIDSLLAHAYGHKVGTAGSYEFPLTQYDLADATGFTAIHVNRVLKRLRTDGTLVLSNRTVTMADRP